MFFVRELSWMPHALYWLLSRRFEYHAAKSSFQLGQRAYELASYLLRATPESIPLQSLKQRCLRAIVLMQLRWFRCVSVCLCSLAEVFPLYNCGSYWLFTHVLVMNELWFMTSL